MLSFKNTLGAAALVLLSAPLASASVILIDDFSANGGAIAALQGNPATATVTDPSILGGTREMWVSTDDPVGNFGTSFNVSVGAGELSFGNNAGVQGQAVLIYDGGGVGSDFTFAFADLAAGVSGDIDVDTDGLGGVDFLLGSDVDSRSLNFSGSDFDQGVSFATFTAYAWDMDGNLVTYNEFIGGPGFDENLPLTDFVLAGGSTTFDWENVGAIAFSIEANTDNFDGNLGSISVVPLPASALLLLGGLGGLAGARTVAARRRRNAA